jgi:hypothetical protein
MVMIFAGPEATGAGGGTESFFTAVVSAAVSEAFFSPELQLSNRMPDATASVAKNLTCLMSENFWFR